MAQAIESATRMVDAFNRSDVEAVLAEMHPEIEFIPRRAPITGAYHGHDGVRKFFADNEENFDLFQVEADEIYDLGDRVLGIGKLRIRGRGSGVDVTAVTGVILTFSEGKVIRFEDFGDREKALQAAGLSAETLPSV
jgi:ketosteroid isomerase-like protein